MLSGSNVRGAGKTSSVLNPVDAPSSSPDRVFQLGGADLAIKRDAKYHVARELRRRELIDTERRYLLDGPNDPIAPVARCHAYLVSGIASHIGDVGVPGVCVPSTRLPRHLRASRHQVHTWIRLAGPPAVPHTPTAAQARIAHTIGKS